MSVLILPRRFYNQPQRNVAPAGEAFGLITPGGTGRAPVSVTGTVTEKVFRDGVALTPASGATVVAQDRTAVGLTRLTIICQADSMVPGGAGAELAYGNWTSAGDKGLYIYVSAWGQWWAAVGGPGDWQSALCYAGAGTLSGGKVAVATVDAARTGAQMKLFTKNAVETSTDNSFVSVGLGTGNGFLQLFNGAGNTGALLAYVLPFCLPDDMARMAVDDPYLFLRRGRSLEAYSVAAASDAVNCSPGNAAAAGTAATINSAETISCTPSNATAAGTTATINSAETIACTPGNAVAAGPAADIIAVGNIIISCTPGNAVAAGVQASINSAEIVSCAPGSAAAAGVSATANSAVTVVCTQGTATAEGTTAGINSAVAIACTSGNAVASGVPATIASAELVSCTPGGASAAGVQATVQTSGADTVSCTPGNAAAAGVFAVINSAETVICTAAGAVAAGAAASIFSDILLFCTPADAAASGVTCNILTSASDAVSCSPGNAVASAVQAFVYSGLTLSTADIYAIADAVWRDPRALTLGKFLALK